MSDVDLSVFVELGVGLAGYSGVVVAFARRSGQHRGRDPNGVEIVSGQDID